MASRNYLQRFAPWAVVAAWALALTPASRAQPRHDVETPLPVALNSQEAAARLEKFRGLRLPGDYCARFELLGSTHDRKETRYEGIVWGTWNAQGPLMRFQIRPAPVKTSGNTTAANTGAWEWLVQNGAAPRVWVLAPGAAGAREVPAAQWREPLFPGLVYSPFDLLTPFVYWPDFQYAGPSRFRAGRSADIYLLQPPKTDAGAAPVKIYLDREFAAPLRVEFLDARGRVARTLDLESFKSIDGDYLMTSYGLLDEVRQDYDVLTLKSAALRQRFDAAVFDPAKLTAPATVPPDSAWTRW